MSRVTLAQRGHAAIHERTETLNAEHRCDNKECPAHASVRCDFPGDLVLLFCRHHWRQAKTSLIEQCTDIVLFAIVNDGDS